MAQPPSKPPVRRTLAEIELEEAEKLYAAERGAGFQDLASNNVYVILAQLESKLAMLSEVDADFITGARYTLDEGGRLTPEAQLNIVRIAKTVGQATHNVLSEHAPLSMVQVIKDLASSIHMLTPREKQFAEAMAAKIRDKVKMSEQELGLLLKIHAAKGF